MSSDPAASVALDTLRRARAQQEATHRWLRRLAPPLFAVVAVAVFTSGRNPGFASRDVATAIAVGGFALGGLGALGDAAKDKPGKDKASKDKTDDKAKKEGTQ